MSSSTLPPGIETSRPAGAAGRSPWSNVWSGLLDPARKACRWTIWESAALLLYLAVVAFGVHQHVPWPDESQAWMLAREVTLRYLLTHSLHYEGTPGLWHTFLMLLQACHFSITGMRWAAGMLAGLSTAVLLAFSPFPRSVRLLLPFSFFLAYQDAVVARSYVLFAILAFSAAAVLRSRRWSPLTLVILLGLIAQISVHGCLASGGLAIVALVRWLRLPRPRPLPRTLAAGVLLLVFWAGAIVTMAPAPDIDYVAGNNVQRSLAKLEQQVGLKAKVPPPLSEARMANLSPTPPAVHTRHGWQSIRNKLVRTLSVITYPLSVFRGLALLLFALVAVQAFLPHRRATAPKSSSPARLMEDGGPVGPIGLTPYLLMVVAFTSLYLAPRHVGMVFTAFVVTAWLTWPSAPSLTDASLTTRFGFRIPASVLLQRLTTVAFLLVLLVQITWTYHALRLEHRSPYSPDRETATYLQQQGVGSPTGGKKAAGFYYYSIGPLAYFDRNIYFNQPPHRYWLWSTRMRTYGTVEEALAQHPDFIVVGGYESGHDAEITRDWLPNTPAEPGVILGDGFHLADYFRRNGYHDTHLFCGHSWMRSTYAERICETVLEPDESRAAAPMH